MLVVVIIIEKFQIFNSNIKLLDSFGFNEAELDHSLPHQYTESFKSQKLLINEEWKPITRENLRSLKVLSSARIESNEKRQGRQARSEEDAAATKQKARSENM